MQASNGTDNFLSTHPPSCLIRLVRNSRAVENAAAQTTVLAHQQIIQYLTPFTRISICCFLKYSASKHSSFYFLSNEKCSAFALSSNILWPMCMCFVVFISNPFCSAAPILMLLLQLLLLPVPDVVSLLALLLLCLLLLLLFMQYYILTMT